MNKFNIKELLDYQERIRNEEINNILDSSEVSLLRDAGIPPSVWKVYASIKMLSKARSNVEISKKIIKSK